MCRRMIPIAYLVAFTLAFIPSAIKAESFDPEAISQVSKAIAEWKLMNESKVEEPPVYVSSSLAATVQKGDREGIGVVTGLAAFDSSYEVSVYIPKMPEMPIYTPSIPEMSIYIPEMPMYTPYNAPSYQIEPQIWQWELNRSAELSNKYISRLPDNPMVDMGGSITTTDLGIGAHPAYGIANTTGSAVITGMETIDRVGTSMQIMNPPIYLDEKTSWGWQGEGAYSIPGGHVHYQETLDTSASRWWESGNITQTHTDWIEANTGNYIRHVETITPATNPFERFMMHHYPVDSYFEPGQTIMTTTTIHQGSYRIETYNGATTITPLPNSSIGTGMGNILTLPTYTPSMPKMPIYTPSIPKIPAYTLPCIPSSSIRPKY